MLACTTNHKSAMLACKNSYQSAMLACKNYYQSAMLVYKVNHIFAIFSRNVLLLHHENASVVGKESVVHRGKLGRQERVDTEQ